MAGGEGTAALKLKTSLGNRLSDLHIPVKLNVGSARLLVAQCEPLLKLTRVPGHFAISGVGLLSTASYEMRNI